MCSYCGCEAEPVIEELMADHADISDMAYRILGAVERGDAPTAERVLVEVADRFARHSEMEEAGLFAQLRATGEAVEEVERLTGDHRRFRTELRQPGLVRRPAELRSLLMDLTVHAETEDDDLFPFAIQVLPALQWDSLNARFDDPVSSEDSSAGARVR